LTNLIRTGFDRRIGFLHEFLDPWFNPSAHPILVFNNTCILRCLALHLCLRLAEFALCLTILPIKKLFARSLGKAGDMFTLLQRRTLSLAQFQSLPTPWLRWSSFNLGLSTCATIAKVSG